MPFSLKYCILITQVPQIPMAITLKDCPAPKGTPRVGPANRTRDPIPSLGFHLITPRGLCLLPFLVDSVPEWTSPLLADITSRGERAKDWDSCSGVSLQRILLRLTTQRFLANGFLCKIPNFSHPQKNENGSCYCNESSSECTSVQYAAYITYSYVNQTLLLPMMSLWVSGTPVEAGVVLIFIGNKIYIFSLIHRNLTLALPEAPILALLYILICVSKYVFNGTNQNVKCSWHIWEKGEF